VLGVGVTIGAGIFVLAGVAAATKARPAISLSFVLAAVVCGLAALCYAEFAALVPAAGSAYTYSFATLGQLIAFIIGWDLVLEFTLGASAVAVGFAGYLNSLLDQLFGVTIPDSVAAPPGDGGTVNVFGIAIVLLVGFILVRGIRITARTTTLLVGLTLAVLLLVVAVGSTEVDTANWHPFAPFGFDGIVGGASLVFFAYIGFDVVATTAEEARDPQRAMPIGIIGSLAIVTVVYVAVALVLTGMVPYTKLNSDAPVAEAFKGGGQGLGGGDHLCRGARRDPEDRHDPHARAVARGLRDGARPAAARGAGPHTPPLWHPAQDHVHHDGGRGRVGGLRALDDAG